MDPNNRVATPVFVLSLTLILFLPYARFTSLLVTATFTTFTTFVSFVSFVVTTLPLARSNSPAWQTENTGSSLQIGRPGQALVSS